MHKKNRYTHINVARFIIEAATPISIGTGEKDFITDAPVLKDINGLPYIPGSSLAGVVRHAIGEEKARNFFGFSDQRNPDNNMGSEIIFSNAVMIGKKGEVLDGLINLDFTDSFYSKFQTLPIRQHNRINHKGVVEDAGKFDEQVVYKGTRFCFEIENVSDNQEDSNFSEVINTFFSKELRIGSGTRSGFGEIKIVSCTVAALNLENLEHLRAYIDKSSSLRKDQFWSKDFVKNQSDKEKRINDKWTEYSLELKADDFFLFGSGFGNDDADMTPVRESIITWNNDIPEFEDDYVLIPATSMKGAISHRVAYHYNKLEGVFADKVDEEEYFKHVGNNNKAIRMLFGSEGENDKKKVEETENKQQRGNVIFSDLIVDTTTIKKKILNHVAIDRFTGGAIEGALFQEEVLFGNDTSFHMKILLDTSNVEEENITKAFIQSLKDITTGMLPLGGGVNRGHGSFNGILSINGETV